MRFAALLTQRLAQRLACALLSLLPLWATAMTLETQGDTVFATGPVGNDLLAFETHLANPAVKQVVFVNSPGGDLWTGLRVGRLIASKSLRTVAAGTCISSCSIMFMGGQERRFSDALPPNLTWVGIHGAHAKDTKRVDPVLQPQIFAWFKLAMGERFDSAVMNQALYEMDDAGGMLRVYDTAHRPRRVTHQCRSGQTQRAACTEFAQVDAMTMGVITHPELVTLALPDAFRPADELFGQGLAARIGDADAWLAQEAQRACSVDACKQKVTNWTIRVTVGPGQPGWGQRVAGAGWRRVTP